LENADITNVKLLITLGILITLFLAAVVILFVVHYQRKMLLKEAHIQMMEQEKQIALFKASVEVEEQQKEKIARNLHDEINPLLVVLKLNLSRHRMAVQKNTFDPENLKKDSDLLDKAIEGIRTTCHDLIPSFLHQFGLLKALEEYIHTAQQPGDMGVEFENQVSVHELEVFDKQDQLNIYRICLEILNNLFKHSKCTQLRMVTQKVKNRIVIEFVHNGKGVSNKDMDIYTENSKGLGLKSLKARSLLLGAEINYRTSVGHSVIQLSIPCPA
jgi:two-component system NarL family sensor kinase